MKIVITGASGNIGRALVPYLAAQNHTLLLVGRDPKLLATMFPRLQNCTYSDIIHAGVGFDVCIHLAVMNNNLSGDSELFRAANHDLLKTVFQDTKTAGCNHFINLTSIHALNETRNDPYSVSKRAADAWLDRQQGIKVTSIRLPAVFSESTTGNLSVIMKIPKFFQAPALLIIGALKPIVHINRVCYAIAAAITKKREKQLIISNPQDENMIFLLYKKFVDLAFVFSVIFLAWWILIIVFLAIKLTSTGPAIFAQPRIGKGGEIFTCYKFRTMKLGTKQAGTHELNAHAITPVGKFLRKSKIDELPQIINIIRGELSLVGPRPCLPMQIELIEERACRGVNDVLPGITGWSQINDIDMSDPVKLAQTDYVYLAQRSIPFELSIIFKTVFGAGRGDRIVPTPVD